jgi:glycosyltransferase involved in cell wall biosynthesis
MAGRVLVVTYYFPPTGGIGYLRTFKYVTYLPKWGWDPVVLTVADAGESLRDPEALRLVPPDLPVVRTRSPEPIKFRRSLGRLVRRVRHSGGAAASPGSGPAASGSSVASGGGWGPFARVWSAFVKAVSFPDQQVGWVPFAVRAGARAARRNRATAVYSSSGPISAHVAAGLIARRTGLPWVADFRDPWIGNAFAAPLPGWQRSLQRRLERWIVARADRVVFATRGLLDAYATRYPAHASKFRFIPNGYDRNDLPASVREAAPGGSTYASPPHASPDRPYRLLYAGSVYGEHELEIFLDGLELLFSRRPELRDRVRVEYVGWLNLHNQAVAAAHDTPDRLAGVVSYTGFLPHEQAVVRMAAADALFNVIADEPEKWRIASGKLPEYLGLDRQIIAFVPEGSARELLRSVDWGIVADPTHEGVADGIERAMATPVPARRADPNGRYDRVNLAEELAAILDNVTAGDAAGA